MSTSNAKTKVVLLTLRHFWRVNIKKLEEYCYVCSKVLLGSPRGRQGVPKGPQGSKMKLSEGFGRLWEGVGKAVEGFGRLWKALGDFWARFLRFGRERRRKEERRTPIYKKSNSRSSAPWRPMLIMIRIIILIITIIY